MHSFLVMSMSVSNMVYFNVRRKWIVLNVFTSVVLMSVALSIQVDAVLREILLRQVFNLPFMMGMSSIVVMLVVVDQMVKRLRETWFVEKTVRAFMGFVERQLVDAESGEVLKSSSLKLLEMEYTSKISKKFFTEVGKLFKDVVVDQFIRSRKECML